MDPSLKLRLRRELLSAIAHSKYDWRTTESLVDEMHCWEADRSDVVGQLHELWREDKIRHPWGCSGNEHQYWRSTDLPMTKQEKRRRFWAIVGFRQISDGSYDGGAF